LSTPDSITDESNSTVTTGRSAAHGGHWDNGDMGYSDSRSGLVELANAALDEGGTPANDFWMPQVTPEGAVSARSHVTGHPPF